MKLFRQLSSRLAFGLCLLAASPGTARACAVCYGEPDSPMSRGLTWGITALVVVVVAVLGGVVAFFIQSNRRALAQAAAGTPSFQSK